MATPTTQELLDATSEAILNVLQNGQHIGSDGRIYTKANLRELRLTRAALQKEVAGSISLANRIGFQVRRRSDPT